MYFAADEVTEITWSDVFYKIINWCKTEGIKILLGLIVVFILFRITDFIFRRIKNRLIKKNADKTASVVLTNFFRITTKVIIVISYLVFIGFETATIGSIIASLGVGIGLALQGGLSNFAGGIIILFTRPFRLDDYIECENVQGTVELIMLFYTKIRTYDNKVIMIPNSKLTSNSIINYSLKPTRRVDINVQMSYDSDLDQVKKAIDELVNDNKMILAHPLPTVNVVEFQDSGIKLLIKVWVKNEDFWTVKFQLQDALKKTFDKYNVQIPFPQMDVHIVDKKQ